MKSHQAGFSNQGSTVHNCPGAHQCASIHVSPQALQNAQASLNRRSFVRTFALLSAASWFGGTELRSLLVADVSAQSSSLPGVFRMNLDNAAFASLRNEVGSVRLSVTGMPTSFGQIIVSRLEGSQFFAVTARCTHEGNPVSAMSLTTRRLVCPTHGSQFAPNGALLAGPASQPLAAYPISFDGTRILTIEIPGLGFVVNMTSVVNATNQTRLQLRFPTVSGVRYDVQFRAALTDGAWTRIPFSTAVDTAPALMTLTGNNTQATVFVEPSSASGFYAIGRGVPV